MAAETDLGVMLASISVTRRPGTWTFVTSTDPAAAAELLVQPSSGGQAVGALIREDEGMTAVLTVDLALRLGHAIEFEAAWLTLEVHSALEAVGLTAAVSRVLADEGIPCNVLAGAYHDHLLVPADRADTAIAAIEGLRSLGSG